MLDVLDHKAGRNVRDRDRRKEAPIEAVTIRRILYVDTQDVIHLRA